MKLKADFAMIGLAVMGRNLAMNVESKGFTVALFNRDFQKVQSMLYDMPDRRFIGAKTYEELCSKLECPRKIMMMIKAGSPVDEVIEEILPYLKSGDILMDGGNSHYSDTNRRNSYLRDKGIYFIGTGVSGGEAGALNGASIMPGGSVEAWPYVKDILQAIAAKVEDGTVCCDWVGENGAGHFVKMVHNGIEYSDMQMISEAYFFMKKLLGFTNEELSDVFSDWNKGELNSYLIEITADILKKKDNELNRYILDLILDAAEQKGTGKWTSQTGLDLGISVPTITEAVFARCISTEKDERVNASKVFKIGDKPYNGDKKALVDDVRKALYASKICSYAQGFQLMKGAARDYKWNLDYGNISLLWRGGCIIRARFLENIKNAFGVNPGLSNLLLDDFFSNNIIQSQDSWRRVVALAAEHGIPVPALSSALCYYDSYRTEKLPANLIQAQRDYFGAHTYERIDRKRGEYFHTDWICSSGGKNTSSQ